MAPRDCPSRSLHQRWRQELQAAFALPHTLGRALEGALECAAHQVAQRELVLPGRILHLRIAALAGLLPGERDRVVEAAQRVDELEVLRLAAGVDAAFRDLPHARFRHAAAL